jgi:hypothetical protein
VLAPLEDVATQFHNLDINQNIDLDIDQADKFSFAADKLSFAARRCRNDENSENVDPEGDGEDEAQSGRERGNSPRQMILKS